MIREGAAIPKVSQIYLANNGAITVIMVLSLIFNMFNIRGMIQNNVDFSHKNDTFHHSIIKL